MIRALFHLAHPAAIAALLCAVACASPAVAPSTLAGNPANAAPRLGYPLARAGTTTDDYHGTNIADPYRWLESDGAETQAWIEAENQLTHGWLAQVPEREALRRRLAKVWNFPKVGVPVAEGGRLFFTKNDGLQNQAVLYVTDAAGTPPRVLLDPNTLRADGTVALRTWVPSRDGKLLGYGLSAAGSDWTEVKVRDVKTGKDLTDDLRWVKFSGIAWDLANEGFYYSRYDAPVAGAELTAANRFQKVYWHRVGTPQDRDILVHERKDQADWGFGAEVSDDGRWLILPVWRGADNRNALYYMALDGKGRLAKGTKPVALIDNFDAEWAFIGNDGPVFWFRTDKAAPRGRIVAVDTRHPAEAKWKVLVAQGEGTLDTVHVVGDRFVLVTMKDAQSEVRSVHMDGRPDRVLALPAPGSAAGFTGHPHDRETWYEFQSFLVPRSVFRLDVQTGVSTIHARPEVGAKAEEFETTQVFYPSKDGTKVPMFIVHRKGLVLDGSHPTLLFGYGGFNISLTPFFSPTNLVWLQAGGVFAMPNLRGGGEYGAAWHEAGMKANKQRVFDDFIGAAEWLVKNKYTSSKKLAIQGGSNGGLLVGACITQRPDLFGAALPAVGVMDMLRFHKFTIGWAWVPEYGSADDAKDFAVLFKYSPLHNIRPGVRYPATMVTTADHDDRVVPGHSFKFAATLQNAQSGAAPVLIRIDTRAGHGAGKPVGKQIDEAADRLAFLVRSLAMPVPSAILADDR